MVKNGYEKVWQQKVCGRILAVLILITDKVTIRSQN